MIFEIVPEELADLSPRGSSRQACPEWRQETVVLIRDEIGNADGIPLIEQVAKIRLAMLDQVEIGFSHFAVITVTRR